MSEVKKFELSNMKITNVLLAAVNTLNYETFIEYLKKCNKDNPFLGLADIRKTVTEEEFDEIKENLRISIVSTGVLETFKLFDDLFNAIADRTSNVQDVMEKIKTYGTVDASGEPEPEDDEKHVKLTGEPTIDSEIIFNLIKQHIK